MGKPEPYATLDLLQQNKLDYLFSNSTNSNNIYSIHLDNVTNLSDIENKPILVKFNTASTGNVQIKLNSFDPVNLIDYFDQNVTNVRQDLICSIVYNVPANGNPNFQLLGKGGEGTATADKILNGYTATTNLGFITGTATLESLGAKHYKSGSGIVDENGMAKVVGLNFTPSACLVITGYTSNIGQYIAFDSGAGSWFTMVQETVGESRALHPVMNQGNYIQYNSTGFICPLMVLNGGGSFAVSNAWNGLNFSWIAIG